MSYEIQIEVNGEVIPSKPNMYAVVMHNDDYTTMDFVVLVLMKTFHKTTEQAYKTMMEVHKAGSSIVGVYTYDIAVSKRIQAETYANANEFPLKLTMDIARE